jgi:hypothetical protein
VKQFRANPCVKPARLVLQQDTTLKAIAHLARMGPEPSVLLVEQIKQFF